MATSPVIGDTQEAAIQPVVAALPISIVEEADINSAAAGVNKALYSGKKEGATYIMRQTADDALVIVVATGAEDVADWIRQDTLVAITPA